MHNNPYTGVFRALAGAGVFGLTTMRRLGAAPPAGVGGNDANTMLLIHSDTTDTSTTFTDSAVGGGAPHALTSNLGAAHSTDRQKFGATSMKFIRAAGPDYVSAEDSNDWNVAAGDFAVDFWVNFTSIDAGVGNIMASQFAGGSDIQETWFLSHLDGNLIFNYSLDGQTNTEMSRAWAPSVNTWYHVALARDGANLRMFIDGTQIGTTFDISTSSLWNSTDKFRLGAIWINGSIWTTDALNGYLDEFRFSKGVPRYTANFTPNTAPYDEG